MVDSWFDLCVSCWDVKKLKIHYHGIKSAFNLFIMILRAILHFSRAIVALLSSNFLDSSSCKSVTYSLMCQFRWYIVTWILLVILWQLRLFVQFCEWYFSGCLFLCFFGFLSHAFGHIDLLDAYLDILISHAMKNMAASHSFRNWIHLYLLFNQLISCTRKMKNIYLIEYFFLILALHLLFFMAAHDVWCFISYASIEQCTKINIW